MSRESRADKSWDAFIARADRVFASIQPPTAPTPTGLTVLLLDNADLESERGTGPEPDDADTLPTYPKPEHMTGGHA